MQSDRNHRWYFPIIKCVTNALYLSESGDSCRLLTVERQVQVCWLEIVLHIKGAPWVVVVVHTHNLQNQLVVVGLEEDDSR